MHASETHASETQASEHSMYVCICKLDSVYVKIPFFL